MTTLSFDGTPILVECRSCGAPVRWTKTSSGASVPIDPDTGASHFTTCPDADAWSKNRASIPPDQGRLFKDDK